MKLLSGAFAFVYLAATGSEVRPANSPDNGLAAIPQSVAPTVQGTSATGELAALDSAEAFARGFYAWYVPRIQDRGVSGVALVLRERSEALAPELRRALAADAARQDSVKDEIVGIDFDPFVGGQDPCERYDIGPAVRVSAGFQVPVWGVCGGRRSARPMANAEVARAERGWVFANFFYGMPDSNLLTILRRLIVGSASK